MRHALLAAALLAAAPTARAESPRYGSFQFQLSGYLPNVDSEFHGVAHPFADAFGASRSLMFGAQLAKSLYVGFGTLDLGVGVGYWSKTGHGLVQGTNTPSPDETALKFIPISLSLTYRFDWLADNYGIPLAPYARASLLRYQWWVTNGAGDTANAGGLSGSGATNGYSFTAGIAFLLDFLDPTMARDLDNDTGINHTYLFVDVTKTYVNNFNSNKSWDLSDAQPVWTGGILFVF
jgi:hypothetical protein